MYNNSLVAITPADFKDTAEVLGQAMGHSGNEFTVPLYTDGVLTHYGLHAWITPEVAQIWLGNAYPETDYTDLQVDAIRTALIISVEENAIPVTHFDDVLTANGLSRKEVDASADEP